MIGNIWGKIAAFGFLVAGIFFAALKLVSIGEAKQKAKAIEGQMIIRRKTVKKVAELKAKHRSEFKRELKNIYSGDFNSFND